MNPTCGQDEIRQKFSLSLSERPVMSQVGNWSQLVAWLLRSFLVKLTSMSHVVTMLERLSLHAEKLLHDPELLLRGIMLRCSYATVLWSKVTNQKIVTMLMKRIMYGGRERHFCSHYTFMFCV